MHQLVAEDVIVVRVDAVEGHDDARPQPLRDALDPLCQILVDDVRLLEIGVIGVEDQRLAVKRVPEGVRVARVPPLSHSRVVVDDERLRRIEEVVEVIGAENLPVELLILDLVAPEILRARSRRERSDDSEQGDEQR